MNIDSIRYRVQLLSAKNRGCFARISWLKLLSLMPTPTMAWPSDELAEIVQEDEEEGLVEYFTSVGKIWGPSGDRVVLAMTALEILSGVYEYRGASIRPGDIVFDMGCNLGTFTRLALDRGAERVVAFEPQPFYRKCIGRTFAQEISDGRLTLVEQPLWSDRRTVFFDGASLVGHIADTGVPMETVTLDEVFENLKLPRVDFMKADIEGAERHALQGAKGILTRFSPRLAFCVYHYPDDPAVIGGILREVQKYKIRFESSGRYVYAWQR